MDSAQFDQFTQTVTRGLASRRLVARGLFAATVAGIPLLGNGLDALGKRRKKRRKKKKLLRCSGDSCDGTGGKSCGGRDECQCYRAAKGDNVCASSLQSSCEATCDSTSDCPKGHVCVEGGPACCGNGVRFCKKACYK